MGHMRRNERPLPRVYADGRKVWVARWTDERGQRSSAGTFKLQGPCRDQDDDGRCCAQHAIWAAYGAEKAAPASRGDGTVGAYAATWLDDRPRAERTNTSYRYRLSCVLDVRLDGRPLRDWRIADVRRRQVKDLIGDLLVVQRRARLGALGILWVLSAMWQDAIDDELAEVNPFAKASIKASDPRIAKRAIPVRVFSWDDMHGFARAAGAVRTGRTGDAEVDRWRAAYAEAMVRVLSDCGLRLGELLGLFRADFHDGLLEVRRTAWHGRLQDGTKTDHGELEAGRTVPVPPTLAGLLAGMPPRIGTPLLFAGVRGGVWQESLFYRDVWRPTQKATGMDCRPHELRHSYVSRLRAAGIDWADLADAAGHTIETAARYTHPLHESFEAIRGAIG